MRTICVAAQKGGVGKTTTSAALAQAAAQQGKRVLLVDLDQQGSLTGIVGADGKKPGSYALMKGKPARSLTQTIDRIDVIVSDSDFPDVVKLIENRPGRDFILSKALEPVQDSYDLAILDTAPALDVILINALTAATHVIIPLNPDAFALQSLDQLAETIADVKQFTNQKLTVTGILLTRYNTRTVLARDVSAAIAAKGKALGIPVHKTVIRESVSLREAQTMHLNLYQYAPRSTTATDYIKLLEELEL